MLENRIALGFYHFDGEGGGAEGAASANASGQEQENVKPSETQYGKSQKGEASPGQVGADNGKGRRLRTAGIGRDRGQGLQHAALLHHEKLPGLLVPGGGRRHGGTEDRQDLLLFHRLIGIFADADSLKDFFHVSAPFVFPILP